MKFKGLISMGLSLTMVFSSTSFGFANNISESTNTEQTVISDIEKSLLSQTIVLRKNSPLSFVYGNKCFIDNQNNNFVPIVENGVVLLPVRFLSDCIGATINWDSKTILPANVVEAFGKKIYYDKGYNSCFYGNILDESYIDYFVIISNIALKTDDTYNNNDIYKITGYVKDELTANIISEEEIYNKLVEHYKNRPEDDDFYTVEKGNFYNAVYYNASVFGGVPGNPTAYQRIYDVYVNTKTGEVHEDNVFFGVENTYYLNIK